MGMKLKRPRSAKKIKVSGPRITWTRINREALARHGGSHGYPKHGG